MNKAEWDRGLNGNWRVPAFRIPPAAAIPATNPINPPVEDPNRTPPSGFSLITAIDRIEQFEADEPDLTATLAEAPVGEPHSGVQKIPSPSSSRWGFLVIAAVMAAGSAVAARSGRRALSGILAVGFLGCGLMAWPGHPTPKTDTPAALAGLEQNLRHKNPYYRSQAAARLLAHGERAVPTLIGILADRSAEVRRSARRSLVGIGAPAVKALLETVQRGGRPATEAESALYFMVTPPQSCHADVWAALQHPASKSVASHLLRFQIFAGTAIGDILANFWDDDVTFRDALRPGAPPEDFIRLWAGPGFAKPKAKLEQRVDTREYTIASRALAACGDDGVEVLLNFLKTIEEKDFRWESALNGMERAGPAARAAIPTLQAALSRPQTDYRQYCLLKTLLAIGDPSALRVAAQSSVAVSVVQLAGRAGVPALIEILHREVAAESVETPRVIGTLGILGPLAIEAGPALVGYLERSDDSQRGLIMNTLAKIGDRDAAPKILACALAHPATQREAAPALAALGADLSPLLPPLLKSLADKDIEVAGAAARTLGQCGPAALPALTEELRNRRNAPFRVAALEAIRLMGPSARRVAPVIAPLTGSPSPALKLQVVLTLDAILADDDATLAALTRSLKASDPAVRMWAARALCRFEDRAAGAVEGLMGALGSGNDLAVEAAAEALAAIGPAARPAVAVLAQQLPHFRGSVTRIYAARALVHIGPDVPEAALLRKAAQEDTGPFGLLKEAADDLDW